MMIGGTVIEAVKHGESVWINTRDGRSTCAISVKACAKASSVSEGDSIWWHGEKAYWSPKCVTGGKEYSLDRVEKCGVSKPPASRLIDGQECNGYPKGGV